MGWTNATVELTNRCRTADDHIGRIAFSNEPLTFCRRAVRSHAFSEQSLCVLTVSSLANFFVHAQKSSTHCANINVRERSSRNENDIKSLTTFQRTPKC